MNSFVIYPNKQKNTFSKLDKRKEVKLRSDITT